MKNNSDSKILIFVGKNASGKTYQLNSILKNSNFSIMFTGDGAPLFSKYTNSVTVDYNMEKYIYNNELERGKKQVSNTAEIDSRLKVILKWCNQKIINLNTFSNLSKGQEKFSNMLKALVEYNLNNIEYIIFDEPDTYLDEEYLKMIVGLINLLVNANIKVRIATHNSRLLKILDLDISNIILLNRGVKNISLDFEEIKRNYSEIACAIEGVRKEERIDMTSGIEYKLNLAENLELLSYFIEQNIKSESFFRCLFCSKVFIVEGDSDIIALNNIKDEFDSSISIFSANGKAFIPFFVWLFKSYKKEIIVIIDEDEENKQNAYEITLYLKELHKKSEVKLITHIPDLEKHYGINSDEIADKINMTSTLKNRNRGWLKAISSYIFFKNEDKRCELKMHILGENSSYEFK